MVDQRLSQRRFPVRLRTPIAFAAVVGFVSIMFVEAYAQSSFSPGADEDGLAKRAAVPRTIREGGAVIDTTHHRSQSYHLPGKTIALTFDDGPDRRWTPAILNVLRRHHVTGTFFVVGTQVTHEPDLVRRIVGNGNEVGIHTFTHPDLSKLDPWRRDIELSLTQLSLSAATGRTTSILREPYSSGPSAISDQSWQVIRGAGDLGYLAVVSDLDSHDWSEHDVRAMIQNATPDNDRGSVVLWHDGGGDRSRTVAALDLYIPAMLARGYRFTTVSEGLRMAVAAAGGPGTRVVGMTRAPMSVVLRGYLVLWTVRLSEMAFTMFWWLFIMVGVLTVGRTLAMFAFAGHHVRRRRSEHWSWGPPVTDPVSVIVPAYNEKEGIEAAVNSLARSLYPVVEVIVVDDGSTDGTADIVKRLRLPNVRVIRRANGGKSSALNVGIREAKHDIIVMVDGDTVFEPHSIHHLVQPFGNSAVGAVSGNVKIGNRDTMVARWQHIEYVIGFNLDRRFYDTLHCMPTIPGAIGAYRRSVLDQVGGISDDTLAEDTDLTMAICRSGWHVVYEEKARAWTEAPSSVDQLWKQRFRWCYGTMQAMWKHRSAMRSRSMFGLVGMPMLAVFGIVLPLFAPIFDVLAIYGACFLNRTDTMIAWLLMLAAQTLTAIVAFRLDRERLAALWSLPLQQFAYRQIMYLVAIQSVLAACTGVRLRWQKLRRVGITFPAGPVIPPANDCAPEIYRFAPRGS